MRAPVIRQRPQELGRREPPRLVRAQGTRASPPDLFTPPLSAPPRGAASPPPPKELTLSMAALSAVLDRAGLRHVLRQLRHIDHEQLADRPAANGYNRCASALDGAWKFNSV